MTPADVRHAQDLYRQMKSAGQGSRAWREALDHLHAWLQGNLEAVLNACAAQQGVEPMPTLPQSMVSGRAA